MSMDVTNLAPINGEMIFEQPQIHHNSNVQEMLMLVQSTPVITRQLGARVREREVSGSLVISRCGAKAQIRDLQDKYSLLMHGIKFESFAKFIFECKSFSHMWVYPYPINVKNLYKKNLLLIMAKSQSTPKPELYAALYGWWNIIRMYDFHVWIMNFIIKFRISPITQL